MRYQKAEDRNGMNWGRKVKEKKSYTVIKKSEGERDG